MTAASYTTDLSTIVLMETGDTFEEFTGYALGDNAALETDWYLQGNSCASDEANNKTGVGHSIGFDYGSNITFATGDCFFGWMQCMAGNAMDTFANGGYRVLIGSGVGDFDGWKVGGSDFGRNPYGGWTNVAVDPAFTPDYTTGTPTAYRHFAVAFNLLSGISKGRPNCADAYRYGRGELIIEFGDLTNGYGNFDDMATQNDGSSNRWGLFQKTPGGYLWKGLQSFGNATNACDFRDSNVNITIDDTPRTYADFNKIEINNTGSRVDWTAVNISAPKSSISGSVLARGNFEVVDNADVNKDTCVFTDMGTFKYLALSTILNGTYRRCNLVTQAGSTITSTIFDDTNDSEKALLSDNPSLVTNCNFISGGTKHGIRCDTIGTYNWTGNTDSGYTGTRGTNLVSSSGSTAAMFYNNSGGLITLNVGGGGQQPSVRNGAGATTQVNASVTVTFDKMKDFSEIWVFEAGTYNLIPGGYIEDATTGTTDNRSFAWSAGAGASVDYKILAHSDGDETYKLVEVLGYTVPTVNTTVDIQQTRNINMEYLP